MLSPEEAPTLSFFFPELFGGGDFPVVPGEPEGGSFSEPSRGSVASPTSMSPVGDFEGDGGAVVEGTEEEDLLSPS